MKWRTEARTTKSRRSERWGYDQEGRRRWLDCLCCKWWSLTSPLQHHVSWCVPLRQTLHHREEVRKEKCNKRNKCNQKSTKAYIDSLFWCRKWSPCPPDRHKPTSFHARPNARSDDTWMNTKTWRDKTRRDETRQDNAPFHWIDLLGALKVPHTQRARWSSAHH